MDKTRYSKTRYQNIYKNIKNKNYIVSIANPKTTISTLEGKKIYEIEKAIKLRDDYRNKIVKGIKTAYIDTFDVLWNKYINDCKNTLKLSYNTLKKKKLFYDSCLNHFDKKKVAKITKEEIILFINKLDKTDKQKNEILICLKSFLNWCCKNEYLLVSPAKYISKHKTLKPKLNYWLPEDLKNFLKVLNKDIKEENSLDIIKAYTIKIFTLLTFNLGDRVGETRALTFGCINNTLKTINIKHSINYDPKINSFYSNTKNYHSQRTIDVSEKLIDEINNWKSFLENRSKIKINDNTPIILNLKTNKPLSDTTIRKIFYYYADKANVPKIRMYDLRHTFVTTMMSEGWSMYAISNKVGHKRITTTINTYGNISEKTRKEMANTTDKYY